MLPKDGCASNQPLFAFTRPSHKLRQTNVNLSSAPEHVLRRMFESFRLQVRYDRIASWATCRVAIKEDALDQLQTDSSALFAAQTNDPDGVCSLLVGAPGRAHKT